MVGVVLVEVIRIRSMEQALRLPMMKIQVHLHVVVVTALNLLIDHKARYFKLSSFVTLLFLNVIIF